MRVVRFAAAAAMVGALLPALTTTGAQAAATLTSMSLSAGRSVLDAGDRVTLSGHVRGLPRGSAVRLDRQRRDGWVRVETQTLPATHDYRFRVTPPHGRPTYRVTVRAPDGRRLRQRVSLTVRWTPALTVHPRWVTTSGEPRLVLTGTTSYAGDGRTRVEWESRSHGSWTRLWDPRPAKVSDGRYRMTGFQVPGQHGRVRLRGDGGARLEATAEFRVPSLGLEPIVFHLNDPAGTGHPATASWRDNLIRLPAHRVVTLQGATADSYVSVTDPEGLPIAVERQGDKIVTLTTTGAGRYTITRVPGVSGALYASTPLVLDGELGTPLALDPGVPGRAVEVRFAGHAVDVVTVDGWWPDDLLGPDGEPVPWPAGYPFGRPLPTDGTYTARYTSGAPGRFDLGLVPRLTAEVGGADVGLPLSSNVVVDIPAQAGEPFFWTNSDCDTLGLGATMHDPHGAEVTRFGDTLPPEDGTYRLFLRTSDVPDTLRVVPSTVLPLAVDGDPATYSSDTPRCHVLRTPFAGTAGQLVRVSGQDSQEALPILRPELRGPDELALQPVGGNVFRLPVDGGYAAVWNTQFWYGAVEPWTAELAVTSVTPIELAVDGSPSSLASAAGSSDLVGHLDVPAGAQVTVQLDPAGTFPHVSLSSPTGGSYGSLSAQQTTRTFTVGPGGIVVYASTFSSSPATLTVSMSS